MLEASSMHLYKYICIFMLRNLRHVHVHIAARMYLWCTTRVQIRFEIAALATQVKHSAVFGNINVVIVNALNTTSNLST